MISLNYRRGVSKEPKDTHKTHCDHDHSHDHAHGPGHQHHMPKDKSNRSFAIAFFSNLGFAIIEIIGGILTNSLAITADAVHDLGDALSIGFAWGLENYSKKESNKSFNFGYRRFSLFAALISGVVIASGAVGIAWAAIARFSDPRSPATIGMAGLALLGVVVNGAGAYALGRGHSQNEKMLTWHLLEDLFGWIVVLVGAITMHFTGWTWIDPLLAIGLSGFILWNILKHLRETIFLMLQGRPTNFEEKAFLEKLLKLTGVASADSIRVWSLDGSQNVMSLRIHIHFVQDHEKIERIKTQVREIAQDFGVRPQFVTIETCLVDDACQT